MNIGTCLKFKILYSFLFVTRIDDSLCRTKTTNFARLERNVRVTIKFTLNLNDSSKSEFSYIKYNFTR